MIGPNHTTFHRYSFCRAQTLLAVLMVIGEDAVRIDILIHHAVDHLAHSIPVNLPLSVGWRATGRMPVRAVFIDRASAWACVRHKLKFADLPVRFARMQHD